MMTFILYFVVILVIIAIVGLVTFTFGKKTAVKEQELKVGSAETRARSIIDDAVKTAETKKREALLEAKEEALKHKNEFEKEQRERRRELQQQELELLSASLAKTGTAAPEPSYTLSGGSDGVPLGSNLSALMEQWAQTESSRALQITGIAQFNLDVLCFQHAMGVGCTAAAI